MTETEFESKLLPLIKRYKEQEISMEEYVEQGRELANTVEHKQIPDFEDEELGWAMYWFEEMDFYGVDDVLENKFNYIKFYEERTEDKEE